MTRAVHFRRIEVRRMPGFPQGGLHLNDLVPGVNVVYGPNASGKTTLSRAIQRSLRRRGAGRDTDSLIAELAVGGQLFELDLHLGQPVCRSDGTETELPPLVPAEVGERYVLTLHDLIQHEDDRGIVQEVLREAAGGYDLSTAAGELGFDRDQPKSRNTRVVKEVNEATGQRKKAEQRLAEIQREADQLAQLEQRHKEAHEAQLRMRVIERALNALDKRQTQDRAKQTVAAFPDAMPKMVGNEWEQLTDLKEKLQSQHNRLAAASTQRSNSDRDFQATGLPEEGVSTELIETLQNRCETLRERAGEISRLERESAGIRNELEEVLTHLGSEIAVERAAELDSANLDELFKFVRQAEECQQEGEAAERLASWLDVVSPADASPDNLRDGIQLLHQWLAEQRVTQTATLRRAPWIIASVLTAVAAGALSFVHLSWLLLLLPAAGLAAWPFLSPRLAMTHASNQDISEQWSGLGFSPPAAWTAPEVQMELRRLQSELATAQLHQEKSQRFADLEERRSRYKKQRARIEEIRQHWRQRLGIAVDVDDARLYLLAGATHRFQIVQERQSATEEELANGRSQHNELLKQINSDLAPYVVQTADDAAQASAQVRQLDQRREAHEQALQARSRAEDDICECNAQIKKLQEHLEELFTNLGLTFADELTLHNWCEQFAEYGNAKESLRFAERAAQLAAAELDDHKDLLEQTHEELNAELESCRRTAGELSALDNQIGDVRGRVDRAKKETALESALSREDDCLNDLRTAREQDAAELVGNVLTEFLVQQQRDVQQPGVLRRAAELFAAITHGRYKLLIRSERESLGFMALDTSLGREQALNELSSGTRLQLLLAVRVAFVEQREQGLKLPLVFDETLGNSDEQRARRIIEAAITIARDGRQVFYFTAQHDELVKWRRILQDVDEVPHREFDLARQRGFSEVEHAPDVIQFESRKPIPIPTPEGNDWWNYGRRLNMPPLDCRGHSGGIHLWYLIDNVHELHRLLTHDINRWGQLQTLVEIGAVDGLDAESSIFRRADAAARLLDHLFRLWRQGRGEPVDRSVLEASESVSGTFIDKISQLVDSLEGDARRLIEHLRDGVVARFRTAQIGDLEEYLIENGYLDDRELLNAMQIREAVTPLIFADRESGLLTSEHVDHLIALVAHNTPPVAEE